MRRNVTQSAGENPALVSSEPIPAVWRALHDHREALGRTVVCGGRVPTLHYRGLRPPTHTGNAHQALPSHDNGPGDSFPGAI